MQSNIKIAVLLTCHNRRALTEECLISIDNALDAYNKKSNQVSCHYYLTDDKCTDGTADSAFRILGERLTVVSADGNAFWAGGMRLAWRKALESDVYDFFLLVNDDAKMHLCLFDELFESHEYAIAHYGKGGIYSGNTCWKTDKDKISFGGKIKQGLLLKRFVRLKPNGIPQSCDIVNANILMVSNNVVETVGIFPDCYIHGAADNDYGERVKAVGLPVLITPGFCGACDANNYNVQDDKKKMCSMTLEQRKLFFTNPVHSIHDTIEFSKRWRKGMLPAIWLLHKLHVYSPWLYYKLRYRI